MMAFKITAVFGLLIVGSGMSFARPQASGAEDLEGRDLFDPNPVYTYTYQVANEDAQTYIAQTESRDGAQVDGEYSYVDPLGNLVTVKYTANDVDGYSETREVQENFIQIRAKPTKKVVSTASVEASSSGSSDSDLVARIIAQLSPFIKETVSSSLSARQQATVVVPAPVPVAIAPQPVAVAASAVQSRFGTGAGNNIRVETPEYTFATDL